MTKDQVALILTEIATLLELKGENPFKSRAYVNAARSLEALNEPLEPIFAPDSERRIKGVGDSLHEKISELLATGKPSPHYDELKASLPPELVTMLEHSRPRPQENQGPSRQAEDWTTSSSSKKGSAILDGKVADLDGFGEKSQTKILEGIQFRRQFASRHLLSEALAAAEPLLENLRSDPDVVRCSAAGSLRRNKEIIGDIDLLASSKNPVEVIDFFTKQPGVLSVTAKGDTRASVVLDGGIQTEHLRVVSDTEFPFALAYFTGSKEHNIVMRQRAIQRGLRLNEYGLFKSGCRNPRPCAPRRMPHRRRDFRETRPDVRPAGNSRGFRRIRRRRRQRHSAPSRMDRAQKAPPQPFHPERWPSNSGRNRRTCPVELGCEYWGITDHSKSSFQANGLQPEKLREQLTEISKLNKKFGKDGGAFRFIAGSEVDILAGGRLDFDDDLLAELDIVVASVHQGFTQNEDEMTKRLIRVAENPYVHILWPSHRTPSSRTRRLQGQRSRRH